MPQNMPSLNRVLGTAALASVIVALLMSYQWRRPGRASHGASDTASCEMISASSPESLRIPWQLVADCPRATR